MTETVGGWAARAARLPAALVESTPVAVKAAAQLLQVQTISNVAAATGGDGRLSRVRSGRGASIKVAVRVTGSGSRTRAAVVPTGPIMLVEQNTKAHREPRSLVRYNRSSRGRIRTRGVISIPGVGVFQSVKHPGTQGKRPVSRAFATASNDAARAGMDAYRKMIRTTLG